MRAEKAHISYRSDSRSVFPDGFDCIV